LLRKKLGLFKPRTRWGNKPIQNNPAAEPIQNNLVAEAIPVKDFAKDFVREFLNQVTAKREAEYQGLQRQIELLGDLTGIKLDRAAI